MRTLVVVGLYLAAFVGLFLGVGFGLQVGITAAYLTWVLAAGCAIWATVIVCKHYRRQGDG